MMKEEQNLHDMRVIALISAVLMVAILIAASFAKPALTSMLLPTQQHHISPQLLGRSLDDMRPSFASIYVDTDHRRYELSGKIYEHWKVVDESGIEATLHTEDGMVLSIHTTDSSYRTDAGIGIGDTFADVQEAYADARMIVDCDSLARYMPTYVTAADGQMVFRLANLYEGRKFKTYEEYRWAGADKRWRYNTCQVGHPDMAVNALHIRMPDAAKIVPLEYLGRDLTMHDIRDHFARIYYHSLPDRSAPLRFVGVDHQRRVFILSRTGCRKGITGLKTWDHTFQMEGIGAGSTLGEIRSVRPDVQLNPDKKDYKPRPTVHGGDNWYMRYAETFAMPLENGEGPNLDIKYMADYILRPIYSPITKERIDFGKDMDDRRMTFEINVGEPVNELDYCK